MIEIDSKYYETEKLSNEDLEIAKAKLKNEQEKVDIILEAFNSDFAGEATDIVVALEFVTGTGADLRACTGVFGPEVRLTLDIGKVGGGGSELFVEVTTGEENRP